MVVSLGPGKFYGTSLPRPRIYTDVKFNDERVDPPTPVLDPLLAWAKEAHWSMGGLSFKRLRFQGRIEGNVTKLRAEREKLAKKKQREAGSSSSRSDQIGSNRKKTDSMSDEDSPPPAPIVAKRRRFMDLIDYEDEDEEEIDASEEEEIRSLRVRRRRLVKKLGDDFDRVAPENQKSASRSLSKGSGEGSRTRRQILEEKEAAETVKNVIEEVNKMNSKGKKSKESGNKGKALKGGASPPARVRTSPRLAKRH